MGYYQPDQGLLLAPSKIPVFQNTDCNTKNRSHA